MCVTCTNLRCLHQWIFNPCNPIQINIENIQVPEDSLLPLPHLNPPSPLFWSLNHRLVLSVLEPHNHTMGILESGFLPSTLYVWDSLVTVCISSSLLLLLCSVSPYDYTTICHPFHWRTLGWFQFEIIMNKVIINILVHVYQWIYVYISFEYITQGWSCWVTE